MTLNKPNTKLEWRHNYQYREDHRKVFQAAIVADYPDEEPIPLTEFFAYISSIWDSIPTEWRDHAFIKIGRDNGEYGTAANFDVYLERLETDEEFEARKELEAATQAESKKAQEARERGMLRALKAKYGE